MSENSKINPVMIAIGALVVVVVAGVLTSGTPDPASAPAPESPAAPVASAAAPAAPAAATTPDQVAQTSRTPRPAPPTADGGLTPAEQAAIDSAGDPMVQEDRARTVALYRGMESALRNLAVVQEVALSKNGRYTTDLSIVKFSPSPGITVRMLEGTKTGWIGVASMSELRGTCVMYSGKVNRVPKTGLGRQAAGQGVPTCDSE